MLMKLMKSSCSDCIQKGLYSYFAPKASKAKVLDLSEAKTSESIVPKKSEPKTSESTILNKSKPKTSKSKVLMGSE
ncbi:hypothetical protein P8452_42953 [Trifolium repens]|nr:hypothetical protein P8452_42953 [Trifolium repens]